MKCKNRASYLAFCLTGGLCWLEELVTKQELGLSNQTLLLMRDHEQLNNRSELDRFKRDEERRGVLSGHSSVCECVCVHMFCVWEVVKVSCVKQQSKKYHAWSSETQDMFSRNCFCVLAQFFIKLSFLRTLTCTFFFDFNQSNIYPF